MCGSKALAAFIPVEFLLMPLLDGKSKQALMNCFIAYRSCLELL